MQNDFSECLESIFAKFLQFFCNFINKFVFWICSFCLWNGLFVTNGTSFFVLEPFINTFRMILVRAVWQFLVLLELFEIIKTNGASSFCCVGGLHPDHFFYSFDLLGVKAFAYFAVSILQLQQLLISHLIRIRIIWVRRIASARLDCLLEQPLLFGFDSGCAHEAVHHRHHYDLLFSLSHLSSLHLDRHSNLVSIIARPCFSGLVATASSSRISGAIAVSIFVFVGCNFVF